MESNCVRMVVRRVDVSERILGGMGAWSVRALRSGVSINL